MAIQNIRIKYVVDTNDIEKADKSLDKLTASEKELKKEFDNVNKAAKNSFDTIEKGSDNVNSTVKKIAGTVASAFAISKVIDFGKEIINIRGEFQKLEAVLTNTLGSSGLAKTALNNLKTFAAETNFSVLELTNAFVKLANRGFVPTIEEMRKLGDVANSTGKTFDQLAEAILDAGTFEFERMKEFGIKMKKHGDTISANFKGITTEIHASEEAVQQYILTLGDLQGVAGATEAISQTLEGQMSNLGDAYDSMLNSWGRSWEGFFGGILTSIKFVIDGWNNLVKSSEQLAEEQALTAQQRIDNIAEELVAEKLKDEFLRTKSKEYAAAFNTQMDAEQKKEFDNFTKSAEIKKRAADMAIWEMQRAYDEIGKGAKGLSISQQLFEQKSLQARIDATQKISDKMAALIPHEIEEQKKANAKKAEENQKARDKEYQQALALLAKQEALAKREVELKNGDKVDLLAVEEEYNKKRVDLFKAYNQKNIEEKRDYELTFKEIDKERLDYLRSQETKYNEIVKEANDEKVEIQKRAAKDREKAEEDMYAAFNAFAKQDLEANDAIQQQKKDNAMRIASEMMQGIGMIYNEFKANADAQRQIEADENRMRDNAELDAVKGNKQAEENIKAKYDQIEKKAKYDQAKANRNQAIFNIGLATSEAVMRALAVPPAPNLVLSGIAGGFGALQLALVASRPLPKYAKGVELLEGEGNETSDSILAQLSRGERVVTARENKDYFPALTAIHNRHIPPELLNNFVMNYDQIQRPNVVIVGSDNSGLERELKTVSKKLENLKQVNINIDKGGINAYLSTKNANIELANNYVVI